MSDFTHFLFVDFENVQDVNLELVDGKAVHVTLLIGAKQTKMPTELATLMHRFSEQVQPLKVCITGRNALDLALAFYLGRKMECHPSAHFIIVSQDKDFDAIVSHLKSTGTQIQRCPSFAEAPCFAPPAASRKPSPKKKGSAVVIPSPATVERPVPGHDAAIERRRKSVLEQLGNGSNRNRPRTRRRLVAHLMSTLQGSEQDAASILNHLQQKKILTIDDKDRVQYAEG